MVGPQIVALLKDYCATHGNAELAATYSFYVGMAFLAAGLLLSLTLRRPFPAGQKA